MGRETSSPKTSQLYDSVMDEFGGVQTYARKFLARDLKLNMDKAHEPLAETKDRRLGVESHQIVLRMASAIDRNQHEEERIQIERQEAVGIFMDEIKQQIASNPQLRESLLEMIGEVDMPALMDATRHVLEVEPETLSVVAHASTPESE